MSLIPFNKEKVTGLSNKDSEGKTQEEKPKKETKGDKPPRSSKKSPTGEIYRELADLLEGFKPPCLKDLGDFPWKFETVRARKIDEPIILQIENNTAEVVSEKFVASLLRRYVRNLSGKQRKYNLTLSSLIDVVDEWKRLYIHRTELPRAVGFLSDKDLCLNRLPYDPIMIDRSELEKKAPIFSDYLSRMTNAEAFAARVGSIFDTTAHRKQALWLKGATNSGKSRLVEIICKMVGDSHVVMSGSTLEEKYWKARVVGKRIMVVNETRANFLRTEDFKHITGDKIHMVREMHRDPYQCILEPILFFFSNHAPEVPNDDPLTERIIACDISVIPPERRLNESAVIAAIEPEFPYIAGYCIGEWNKVPAGREIPSSKEVLTKAVESYESSYLDFIANYLELQPEDRDFSKPRFYAQLTHIQKLMIHAELRSHRDQSICKRVILSQRGVSQTRMTPPDSEDAKRVNCYVGLRIRKEHHDLLKRLFQPH